MRRKQFHTFDHPPLLVVVEPILTRLEAGYDRMPRRGRMPGCMLARRTVAAADVPTLRTPAQVKPPALRRPQAFHTPIATRLRSGVDSARTLFHLRFSLRVPVRNECQARSAAAPPRIEKASIGADRVRSAKRKMQRANARRAGSPSTLAEAWALRIGCFDTVSSSPRCEGPQCPTGAPWPSLGRGVHLNKDLNRVSWHRGLRFPADKSNYAAWKNRSHAKIMLPEPAARAIGVHNNLYSTKS